MDVLDIEPNGSKPRKGVLLDWVWNQTDTFETREVDAADFICSYRIHPKGYVLLSILQADDTGVLVELEISETELQPGYLDRKTKLNILTTTAPTTLYTYSSMLNSKVLTVAYRSDTRILSIYYFGKTTELLMDSFVPTHLDLVVEKPYHLNYSALFQHYSPPYAAWNDIPYIQLEWRKWYKEQLELTSGYKSFTDALHAYEAGNDMFYAADFWNSVGLYVDEPVPEDFIVAS